MCIRDSAHPIAQEIVGGLGEHDPHEVDGHNNHRHADQVRLQLLGAVNAQPTGKLDRVNEELIEAHGGDVQDGADQKAVDVLHDFDLHRQRGRVRIGAAGQAGDEYFVQRDQQPQAAEHEEERGRQRQAHNGYQNQKTGSRKKTGHNTALVRLAPRRKRLARKPSQMNGLEPVE